ncbi:MAG: peptidase M16 [Planctomycetaceae bacterium]|nr:peptidase M16 [Planctomycetaceae bacterium]MDP7275500.1 pitrilysin family protein [Planctomycetaceae bacterium]
MEFHEITLENGLHVIAELNPNAQSVGVGAFVRTGARDETESLSGVSHFLEHMAFKGNGVYTADDVNRIFDELGAHYNASTSEEVTQFYAAILPEYLPTVVELLAALLFPSLRQDDFEMEKKVILEEIGMYDDQPTFTAYETVMQAHFDGHPLGRKILGTTDSVSALTAEAMRDYHARQYRTGNMVLAVAGRADWDSVVDLARTHCSNFPTGRTDRDTSEPVIKGTTRFVTRPAALQQHVMRLAPAPPAAHRLRYAADLLAVIVGDDSSSRLYWELVDPGHAESAELGFNDYDGTGTWLTYLGCRPEATADNLERINAVYEGVNREGVTGAELEQAQNRVASAIVLRSERPMGRLGSLGSNWIYLDRYRSVQEDLDTVRGITVEDIGKLLSLYPLDAVSTAAVGALESF